MAQVNLSETTVTVKAMHACVPIITANDHIINALTDDHAR